MTRTKAKKRSNRPPWAVILGCLGLGLVGACVVLGAAGFIFISRLPPVSEQMAVGNLPVLVNLVDPTDGRGVLLKNFTPVHSEAIGSSPIAAIQLWVDGVPVDAHVVSPSANGVGSAADFSWQPASYGQHVLLARAIDASGHAINSNIVRVNAAAPASPTSTFQILADGGDTLTTLADQQGLSVDQLIVFNPGIDPNQALAPDQPITIPVIDPPPSLLDTPGAPPIPPDTSLMPPLPQPPSGPTNIAPKTPPNPLPFWLADNFPQFFPITSAPAAPDLAQKIVGCEVHLYLFDKSGDESGFFVYRLKPNASNFERIATLGANSDALPLEFVDDGLYGSSLYYISAFNPSGESPSNLVGPQINQDSCLEPEQKGLGLDNAKITVAQPVDQLYCYAAFDNGPWRRLPEKPDTFILPQNGEFDLSPHLNLLASPTPTQPAPLNMECWGWRGGSLNDLGQVQYNFKVNEGGPVQIPGPGFILNGIANPQTIILPTLGLANFAPHVPQPSPDGKKIAPPFGLMAAIASDPTQATLVWNWLPIACLPSDQACPYLTDISGYRVYDGTGKVATSVDATHKSATVSIQTSGLVPQCFHIVAFKDDLESEPTALKCVDAGTPTAALPSPEIGAPFNLALTSDAAECKNHLPAESQTVLGQFCDNAAANKSLILTWSWSPSGCLPPPSGQAPACEIISDIEGYHVYRSYLNGPGELLQTINNPEQKAAILPTSSGLPNCYLVQAFKGAVESGPSNSFCATFNATGLTHLILSPSQGASYGQIFTQYNCVTAKTVSTDFPAASFSNPPADLNLNVGDVHKYNPDCDRTTAIWYDGLVGFDLSNLKNFTIQKASFVFHTGAVTKLTGANGEFQGDLANLDAPPPPDCALALLVADGYTHGQSQFSGADPLDLGGSMWHGSTQVAAGPFGTNVAQDVTHYATEALTQGNAILSLLFTADHSHPPTTDLCISRYEGFSLVLELGQ